MFKRMEMVLTIVSVVGVISIVVTSVGLIAMGLFSH